MNDDERAGIERTRAKIEMLGACKKVGASDPRLARSVVAYQLRIEEDNVRVIRHIPGPGPSTMLLEVSGLLIALGSGLDATAESELHLIVECPACSALVAQGPELSGATGFRWAVDGTAETVRPHSATVSADTRLLQSTTANLIFRSWREGPDDPVFGLRCAGVGQHVDPLGGSSRL